MDNTTKNNGNFEAIASNMQKQDQEYLNGSNADKQAYWNSLFIGVFYGRTGLELPLNLNEYKETISYLENDFDGFIPGILDALEDNGFTGTLEDIFILEGKDKNILDSIINNSGKIDNTLQQKTTKIEGINISNEELADKIGDLFYDSLSSFISSLGEQINNKEISALLKEASNNIMTAWEICLPYVSHDFPEMKHTSDVKGLDIDREELVIGISNLVHSELSDFLEKFSLKIEKDGEADKGRGRIKLANELFACSDKLKKASEKI